MPEIDHEYTDEIVCPYCGYVHSDSWEVGSGYEEDSEYECGNEHCEKEFLYSRNISVSYSTRKMKPNG